MAIPQLTRSAQTAATTDFVALAIISAEASTVAGTGLSLPPPPIIKNPFPCATSGGRMTPSQFYQTGRSTSASVSHRCEVRRNTKIIHPPSVSVASSLHPWPASGAAKQRSKAVPLAHLRPPGQNTPGARSR